MKKLYYKVGISFAIALIAIWCYASVALAAPGLIVFKSAVPTDTTITLTWTTASGATSTVIRYRTDTYPTDPADGTSVYSGTGFQCELSGLTAGTVYYFSAWGYDGVDYSASAATMVMNTLPIKLPSGAEETKTNIIPVPSIPASANQTPDISGFQLEPFTSIIAYFNDATKGGLGMPTEHAWEVLAALGIVVCGAGVYIKMKNFFIAYFLVFLLTIFAVALHLIQGYLIPIEIVIGLGVWALERFFQ